MSDEVTVNAADLVCVTTCNPLETLMAHFQTEMLHVCPKKSLILLIFVVVNFQVLFEHAQNVGA